MMTDEEIERLEQDPQILAQAKLLFGETGRWRLRSQRLSTAEQAEIVPYGLLS